MSDETVQGPSDLRWWEEESDDKKKDAIWTWAERVERMQETDLLNDRLHASQYGNVEQFGFSPRSYNRAPARAHARLALNVVRNMVGAVVSKIAAKNKVHPKFMTNGEEESLQRKAKGMEKLIGGIFYQQKFYRKQRLIFRDLAIFGSGFVRPWIDKDEGLVTLERIPKTDILVDTDEGFYGDPPQMAHRKWYDKRVLLGMFPDKEDIIKKAGTRTETSEARPDSLADIVPVLEIFHRPTKKDKSDGLRVVCVDSGVLATAPWKYDYFPFPHMKWTEEPYGFFGTGLAYELAGIQSEINDVLIEFARAHRLIKGGWFADRASKIALKHINDDLGKIVLYSGVPPSYIQPIAIPQSTYQYLWDLYAKAFEVAGISQLSASGQKPAGLNSGEAQRVYLDEQTERFLDVGEALQDFTLDVTEQCVDRCRDLAEDPDRDYVVNAKTDRGMEPISFRKNELPEKSYLVQVFPTSMLPTTPAGRLAFINDLMEAKIVTNPADAMKLLGYPDVEAFMQRENARRELLDRNLESILDEGHWVSPEPLDDHDLAIAEIPKAIAAARNRGVKAQKLSLARRYLVLSVRLKKLESTPEGMASSVMNADPNAAPPPPPGPEGSQPPAGLPEPVAQAA